jgi:hypothetical protein
MPKYCKGTFDRAAATRLLDNSEGPGHTLANHLLVANNRELLLRARLLAPPTPGTPAPEAVSTFLHKDDVIDVLMRLLNCERGQWMLGMMDDGGLAGHVCEEAAALNLPRRIEYASIARAGSRTYVQKGLERVQLFARRYAPTDQQPPAGEPPFYVVTCFPTLRAVSMGIDDWGGVFLGGSILVQLDHNVMHVEGSQAQALKQRAEAYASWLQKNVARLFTGVNWPKHAVAKLLPKAKPSDAQTATPMRPYYANDGRLRAPLGAATLASALRTQGLVVLEEQYDSTTYLMIRKP